LLQYLKRLDSLTADVDRFVTTAGRQTPVHFLTEGSTDRQTQIAAEETDRAALELKVKQSAHANEPLSAEAHQALKELRALGDDCCPEIDLGDIVLEKEPLGSGRYVELAAHVSTWSNFERLALALLSYVLRMNATEVVSTLVI
jgi:hypothetical protein